MSDAYCPIMLLQPTISVNLYVIALYLVWFLGWKLNMID